MIQINGKEFDRLASLNYPVVVDSNGNYFIVVDTILCQRVETFELTQNGYEEKTTINYS